MPRGSASLDNAPDSQWIYAGSKLERCKYSFITDVEIKNCCSPNGLEPVSESSDSGALSLSSAAQHIDFHLLRRIYVALVAHSIALSLQNTIAKI